MQQVTIFDCDMDVTTAADSVTVLVSTSGGSAAAETETFVLRETLGTSGLLATFTGIINISTNKSYQGSGNGVIWTEALPWNGTVLNIKYNDTYSSNSLSPVIRSVLSSACTTPSIYVSQTISGTTLTNTKFSTYGGTVDILVNDGSQNRDSTAVDRASISAFTLPFNSASDIETIALVETGINTGTFTGKIGVSGSDNRTQNDLELSPLSPGDYINFTYIGCIQSNVSITVQCVDRGLWIIDVRPVPISHGRNLTVTISDRDLSTDPLVAETYPNLVSLSFKGINIQDTETISIREAGISSFLFTGSILVSQNSPVQGNGIMEMDCTGLNICNFSRTYTDANFGALTDTSATARRGIVQINPSKPALGGAFLIGEPLNVTAVAGDASISVSVQIVGANNISKIFSLSEIAPGLGIFRQVIQTRPSTSKDTTQNDTLLVNDGQSVMAMFIDPFPVANSSSAILTGRYAGVFSIQPDPIIRTRLQTNGTIVVSLYENDMNINWSSADTVQITLTTFVTIPLLTTSSVLTTTSPKILNTSTTTQPTPTTTQIMTTTAMIMPTTTPKLANGSNTSSSNVTSVTCSSSFTYLLSGSIQINLTETSPNSGQFTGLYLLANASKIFPSLQSLQSFVAFEVCFLEQGSSVTTAPRVQRWVPVNATDPILPPVLLGGSLLQITIQDRDADFSWFAPDSIKVQDTKFEP